MTTLTANDELRPEHCVHKLPTSCRLTALPICCACQDKRPHASLYRKYIDGVGFMMHGATRQERYCWQCKVFWDNRVLASSMRQTDTQIPERPDQSAFLDRWYIWHRGYRIIRHEDGIEERQAVVGENLSDMEPGQLPRTTHELRSGLLAEGQIENSNGQETERREETTAFDLSTVPEEDRLFDFNEHHPESESASASVHASTSISASSALPSQTSTQQQTNSPTGTAVLERPHDHISSENALPVSSGSRTRNLRRTSVQADVNLRIELLRQSTDRVIAGLTRIQQGLDHSTDRIQALLLDLRYSLEEFKQALIRILNPQAVPAGSRPHSTAMADQSSDQAANQPGETRHSSPHTNQPSEQAAAGHHHTTPSRQTAPSQQSGHPTILGPQQGPANSAAEDNASLENLRTELAAARRGLDIARQVNQVVDPALSVQVIGQANEAVRRAERRLRRAERATRGTTALGTRQEVQEEGYTSPIAMMFTHHRQHHVERERARQAANQVANQGNRNASETVGSSSGPPAHPTPSTDVRRRHTAQDSVRTQSSAAQTPPTGQESAVSRSESSTSRTSSAYSPQRRYTQFMGRPWPEFVPSNTHLQHGQPMYPAQGQPGVVQGQPGVTQVQPGVQGQVVPAQGQPGVAHSSYQAYATYLGYHPGFQSTYRTPYVQQSGPGDAGFTRTRRGMTPEELVVAQEGGLGPEFEEFYEQIRAWHGDMSLNEAVREYISRQPNTPAGSNQARPQEEERTLERPDRPAEPVDEENMWVKMQCKVCFTQIATVALSPCGHCVMCRWCAAEAAPVYQSDTTAVKPETNCPVCRRKVKNILTIYGGDQEGRRSKKRKDKAKEEPEAPTGASDNAGEAESEHRPADQNEDTREE